VKVRVEIVPLALNCTALAGFFPSLCPIRQKMGDFEIKPLRLSGVPRASKTLIDAVQNDPLYLYTNNTPDVIKLPFRKRRERLEICFGTALWVRDGMGLTINEGQAVVVMLPVQKERRKRGKKLEKFLKKVTSVIGSIIVPKTPEQKRRGKEFSEKVHKLVETTLGKREPEMFSVNALATGAEFQRRGYGGALVDYITRKADEQGRSTYLLSSNPINEPFYNKHGFVEVAAMYVGDDNPSWKQKPVRIPLMVREYKDHNTKERLE